MHLRLSACAALALLAGLLAPIGRLAADEVIPPAPAGYFTDEAGLVSPETARRLDAALERFERETSDQILVAIYPRMRSDSSVEDYTVRVAQAWKAGQKARNNGAVLFVFVQEHQLYIQVGYGLEGTLPDALCKRIIEDEIVPRMRAGDPDAALTAAVRALTAAARGEYRGDGRTVGDRRGQGGLPLPVIAFIVLVIVVSSLRSRRQVVYRGYGRRGVWGGGPWIFPGGGGGFGGGGGWSGGGGGGGFSGGGGGFGGGGAGGKW